jgi:epoxyqueuosine reductase
VNGSLDVSLLDFRNTLDADFLGVADLSLAQEAVLEQGGDLVAGYPRAVSLGISLLHPLVDQLPRRAERAVAVGYRQNAYDIINLRLDQLSSRVGSWLQRRGYKALPIPASKRVDDARICGLFSHKLATHLAGLGWIGKSCLLITPEAGPRVRWVTVLTDAPLQATGTPMEQRCGDCQQCVQVCPVQAFTGRPFITSEPREARFDARKCDDYFVEMERMGGIAVCGMCLYICPYGKNVKNS